MAVSSVAQEVSPAWGDEPVAFTRDRLTWLVYLLYGSWCLAWGFFGPIMPFLRVELGLNYAQAALHFSALALGVLLAGLVGHRVIQHLGLAGTIKAGVSAIAAGIFCVLLGGAAAVTVGGALLASTGGTFMAQAIVAALNKRFGDHRGKAIAELNVSGSTFAAIAPLTVAAILSLGMGWKAAFAVPLALLGALLLLSRAADVGSLSLQPVDGGHLPALPRAYWLYFVVIFLSVAGEWSVGFWCPEFIEKVVHTSRVDACNALSVFMAAMLAGRIAGTRLIGGAASPWLLSCSVLSAACGFLVFWLSKNMIGCLAGLTILGLGNANVYPLALSAAIGVSGKNGTKAAARMSLSTGSAIFLAPLILGMMADSLGLFWAHALVACLFVLAAIVTLAVHSRHQAPDAAL
ncbi:MAG TPA: MFS transporter [Candidatus Obscuribacterales bacterium]